MRDLVEHDIDEIVLLDIHASRDGYVIDAKMVEKLARWLRIPICVGGGITSSEDAVTLIEAGADKISLNHSMLTNPEWLAALASKVGRQSLVWSIDCVLDSSGNLLVFDHVSGKPTRTRPEIFLQSLEVLEFVGEIHLGFVDRDGSRRGMINGQILAGLTRRLARPVILKSGFDVDEGSVHLTELIEYVDGIAIGNWFGHVDIGPVSLKTMSAMQHYFRPTCHSECLDAI